MTPEKYSQIQQDFLAIRELERTDQELKLVEISKIDPPRGDAVRELLLAERSAVGFLEEPLVSRANPESTSEFDVAGDDLKSDPESISSRSEGDSSSENLTETAWVSKDNDADKMPKQIGPYRILQKIGEGGHGIVYMAEQTAPIRRKVALKLIRPGMESKQILARFEAERQALALMKHPSIANVIDADSSPTGTPYFVMELVHGVPIDQFCWENKLDLKATLSLFQQVCDAVHHAHRKGVIHRDIKPANVLVTVDSGKPLAKVIDFGIAKAMHLSLTEKTMFTEYGQIVGTLEYMSPEQAMMSQNEADVRSDVYSLGVMLYLLLTGTTPISKSRLLEKGIWELKNVIQEFRPPTPSVRFTGSQTAQKWCERSEAQTKSWHQNLKGDLDWITMKALAKELDQRYDSVSAFSKDIDNFVLGRQITARPPTVIYVLSKWILRNRIAASVGLLIVASVLISLAAIGWGFYQSQQNLKDVKSAQSLVIEKAKALETALSRAENERKRADQNARRMAEKLKREILESSLEKALDGDSMAAEQSLNDIAVKDREFVWEFVNSVRQQMDWPSLRSESRGPIRVIAAHKSMGLLAVITTHSVLEIWDLPSKSLKQSIELENQLYNCVSFSTDGTEVLVGASNWVQTVQLKTLKRSKRILHERGGTRQASHDKITKRWLVTTGANFVISVDFAKADLISSERLKNRISSVSSQPDGSSVVVSSLSGDVYILDSKTLRLMSTIGGASSEILNFKWNGNRLFAATAKGRLFQVELLNHQLEKKSNLSFQSASVRPTQAETRRLGDAAITPDFSLMCGDNDGIVRLFPPKAQPVLIRKFSPAISELTCFDSPKVLSVLHFNGRINLIDYQDIHCRQNYAGKLVDLSDGVALATKFQSITAHNDGLVRLWHTQTGAMLGESALHRGEILSLSIDERLQRIATIGTDWKISISELAENNQLVRIHELPVGLGVRPVQFSNSGKLLLGAPDSSNGQVPREGTMDIWDVEAGKAIQRFTGHKNWVSQVEFSRDDNTLLTLALDGTIRVWDVKSGECQSVLDLSTNSPANGFCHLSSRQQVAISHSDGSVSIRSLLDGTVILSKHILPNSIGNMIHPRNSNCLILASENEQVLTCVDTRSLKIIAQFDVGTGNIQGLRLDAESKRLQILGQGGAVRIWDLPPVQNDANM